MLRSTLSCSSRQEQVASWSAPVLDDQAGKAGFRFVQVSQSLAAPAELILQINYQENALKSMLSRFFTASLKRTVPEARWPSYLMANSGWTEVDVRSFSLAPAYWLTCLDHRPTRHCQQAHQLYLPRRSQLQGPLGGLWAATRGRDSVPKAGDGCAYGSLAAQRWVRNAQKIPQAATIPQNLIAILCIAWA